MEFSNLTIKWAFKKDLFNNDNSRVISRSIINWKPDVEQDHLISH